MRPASEFDEAMRWIEMGMTKRQVAELMGIPKATIDSWRRYGCGHIKRGPNHSYETYEEAMRYVALGMNDCEISRLMNIRHRTIRSWRTQGLKTSHRDDRCPVCGDGELDEEAYSYLLGLYLGDGWIRSHHRGVFQLQIYLDAKYPGIIEECGAATVAVRTNGSTKVGRQLRDGCVSVSASWKHWPCLFPQHGPGVKHKRNIQLEPWQEAILQAHPARLLRGLIHSDGYRGDNKIKVGEKTYVYPRYQFCNYSAQIREIFCRACDVYGVRWRQMNRVTIAVSRRPDVAKLDEVIGPKC